MKTAVIYARYSSDRQTEQSIEGQVRVCNDYAERNDILIVNQYVDRATTGTNDNRDAFQQMMKDSDNKFMDTLKIKVSRAENKRMSSDNPYACFYLLSLWRKTEAISTLYTMSISRSLPVIFGKPPTMIRSISS